MRAHLPALAALLAAGCATYQPRVEVKHPAQRPLRGPRVVAFLSTGTAQFPLEAGPAQRALAEALERGGFQVAFFVRDEVPYGLDVRGLYERCDAGFRFNWIEVDVVDLHANRRVYGVRGEGATEGCLAGMNQETRKEIPGTLYRELVEALAAAWAAQPPPPAPGTQAL